MCRRSKACQRRFHPTKMLHSTPHFQNPISTCGVHSLTQNSRCGRKPSTDTPTERTLMLVCGALVGICISVVHNPEETPNTECGSAVLGVPLPRMLRAIHVIMRVGSGSARATSIDLTFVVPPPGATQSHPGPRVPTPARTRHSIVLHKYPPPTRRQTSLVVVGKAAKWSFHSLQTYAAG